MPSQQAVFVQNLSKYSAWDTGRHHFRVLSFNTGPDPRKVSDFLLYSLQQKWLMERQSVTQLHAHDCSMFSMQHALDYMYSGELHVDLQSSREALEAVRE